MEVEEEERADSDSALSICFFFVVIVFLSFPVRGLLAGSEVDRIGRQLAARRMDHLMDRH